LKPGKISENVLKRSVLKYIDHEKTEIARGAGIGNDCALFAFCQGASVATCSFHIKGKEKVRHAIFAAVNNLTAAGQQANYLLLAITLPERAREIKLQEIMEEAAQICRQYGMQIVGGHTEVSTSVTDIVVTVTALSGENRSEIQKLPCVIGYDIVVAGYIGMEAAGMVATEKEEELILRFPRWLIDDLKQYKDHVSVRSAVQIAAEHGAVLMHDVGEGGIFASLWEMSQRALAGITIDIMKIQMRQSVVEVCNHYDLNPYEILSQGCLLILTKDGEQLADALIEADIPAAVIGQMTDSNDKIIQNGEEIRYLDLPKPDQIRKLL
jgi:hydrogenase maturation factor